jgi:hypothetical protein
MPIPAPKPDRSVAAAFKDRVAASIACSLLHEGGVSAEQGDRGHRFGDREVRVLGLLPDQVERAVVILRKAGAIEIAPGHRSLPG